VAVEAVIIQVPVQQAMAEAAVVLVIVVEPSQ